MYCNANKDSCNTFEARCNSTKDACIMQRIYIRRHFLYLRLKSVKELVNYNTRKTMKQKQKLKRWSGVLIALGVLGSSFTSCSSIKKGNDLPVVGKSVALFDYPQKNAACLIKKQAAVYFTEYTITSTCRHLF